MTLRPAYLTLFQIFKELLIELFKDLWGRFSTNVSGRLPAARESRDDPSSKKRGGKEMETTWKELVAGGEPQY